MGPCALDATQVVISAPAGADRTVIASFNGTSTLDTLTIENENTATAGTATTPGQTLYGIFAANATSGQTNLVLTNVDVNVATACTLVAARRASNVAKKSFGSRWYLAA